jgi:hypothetical protein
MKITYKPIVRSLGICFARYQHDLPIPFAQIMRYAWGCSVCHEQFKYILMFHSYIIWKYIRMTYSSKCTVALAVHYASRIVQSYSSVIALMMDWQYLTTSLYTNDLLNVLSLSLIDCSLQPRPYRLQPHQFLPRFLLLNRECMITRVWPL